MADVWSAFQGIGYGEFKDIEELTCFADYRVPQLLRALGILVYSENVKQLIDKQKLIPSGSKYELLIRAGTIEGVERIRKALHVMNTKEKGGGEGEKEKGRVRNLNSVEIDFALWNRGEVLNSLKKIPVHHRTLSVYY